MKRSLRMFCAMLVAITMANVTLAQTYISVPSNQAPKLVADAGTDTTVCHVDTVTIGGSPSATGGTTAYTYSWTTSGNISSTTVANPQANASATAMYKLTVTDAESCTSMDSMTLTITNCTSVEEWELPLATTVSPNPGNGLFRITMEGNYNSSNIEMRVSNAIGELIVHRTIGTVSGIKTEMLDLTNKSTGIYFVDLYSGNAHQKFKLIVR